MKGYNDDPVYFHFSQEGAEKGGSKGGKKYSRVLVFRCRAVGRTLGAEQSGWLSCWTTEREQWKSELCFTGKRQSRSSSKSSMHHTIAALRGKPFKTKSLSLQFSAGFMLTSQSPNGWARALRHLPGAHLHRAETRSTEERRPVVKNGLFTILLYFQSGFLGFLAGKGDWVARGLLRLT